MDYIYSVMHFLASVASDVKHLFFYLADSILNVFTYAWYWLVKLYLYIQLSTIELAFNVATMILQDYEVYTVLNGAFNQLSPDLRYMSYSLGIVDAIRIIIDAFATAFVLRVMGW